MNISPRKRPPFRVQVIVGGDLEYFRNAMLGARHYGFDSGRLRFADRWLEHELAGDLRSLVARDRIDGIVAAVYSLSDEARYVNLGVPVVNISNSDARVRLPLVTQDDAAVGRLAAEHLLGCGCRSFAFWGQADGHYSKERLAGFRTELFGAGINVKRDLCVGEDRGKRRDMRMVFEKLKRWLMARQRPLGIFAVLDTSALQIMRAARELNWRIPEDIALLGAGNDDFWVDFESVPLSSICLPSREIGYEAARLLDQLITEGIPGRGKEVRLPVCELAPRRSTDILFVRDLEVANAVRRIRQTEGKIRVDELVRAVGVSRSGLQARFKAALGRTMLAEIHRVKLEHSCKLLAATDMKLSAVAEKCGLASAHRLSVLFRSKLGQTPSSFRSERRRFN